MLAGIKPQKYMYTKPNERLITQHIEDTLNTYRLSDDYHIHITTTTTTNTCLSLTLKFVDD